MPPYTASPSLINSIIQSESAGNPYAVSPTGARGLMQVQPATARSPGFGVEPFGGGNLFDPEANKQFGTQYFNAMLNRYGGDQEAALVAYNAGPGNADKWVSADKDWSVLPKPEETQPYVTSTLGRLDGDNDMANGNRRRPSVYQPQREAGTGNLSQRGEGANTALLPTAPAPSQDGQGLDLPGKPSNNRLAMARAMMEQGQRSAGQTRGSPLAILGSIAQSGAGQYLSDQYDEKGQDHSRALAEALAGAEGRGDLVNTMLQSGDEGLRNAAVKAQLSQPKDDRTADIKNYEYYRRQTAQSGEKPLSFPEWKKQSKAPLVQMKGETKYEETRGEALANRYGELQADARKAQNRIGRLRAIDDLLSDPSVYTGTGARSINALKRAGQTLFGMDFEGVDKADTAQRFSTEMALSFKEDLPGPMSDADRQFLQEIPPNIGDTAQGRKLLVDLMSQKEQRKVELGRLARQYRQENGRLDDGWYDMASQYAENNPMFDETMMERAKEAAGTAEQRSPYSGVYPSVESDEEYDALESGEMFVDPDGQVRRKP